MDKKSFEMTELFRGLPGGIIGAAAGSGISRKLKLKGFPAIVMEVGVGGLGYNVESEFLRFLKKKKRLKTDKKGFARLLSKKYR